MSETTDTTTTNGTDDNQNNQTTTTSTTQSETKTTEGDKKLEDLIEERLKPIKSKLDSAFAQRDEALKKLAEKEAKEREAELKRLEEEGKHKEAYEMRLAEEKAKREAAEKQNIELARDLELRTALGTLPFRNDAASRMAYQELLGQLVRNEQGVWVHKTGISIKDCVKSFQDSEDNSFLFKTKVSTGGNTTTVKTTTSQTEAKSIFELSQDEVLKLAAEGKLPPKRSARN
jgi:hypothetical protein